jgi:hypothetical protein
MDANASQAMRTAKEPLAQACHCIGAAPGYPACPCAMRGIVVRDGRFIRPEQDLGPVPAGYDPMDPAGRGKRLSLMEQLTRLQQHNQDQAPR